MKKRLVALAWVLALAAALCAPVLAAGASRAVLGAKDGVVRVMAYNSQYISKRQASASCRACASLSA